MFSNQTQVPATWSQAQPLEPASPPTSAASRSQRPLTGGTATQIRGPELKEFTDADTCCLVTSIKTLFLKKKIFTIKKKILKHLELLVWSLDVCLA